MNGYKKVLARRIEFNGAVYHGLVTAEASRDASGRWHVSIGTFEGETHSTFFHNGTVIINCANGYDETIGATEEPEFRLL